jgi:hypothetical protein
VTLHIVHNHWYTQDIEVQYLACQHKFSKIVKKEWTCKARRVPVFVKNICACVRKKADKNENIGIRRTARGEFRNAESAESRINTGVLLYHAGLQNFAREKIISDGALP